MKVLILAGYTRSLVNFRGDLIKDIIDQGNEVLAVGPEAGYEEEISELGAKFVQLPFNRTSSNVFHDIKLLLGLYRLVRSEKPDLIFSYTIKPIIYGPIAARLAGINNIYSMLTGLGFVFLGSGFKSKVIKKISLILLLISFSCCKKVFFQNKDDMNEIINLGLIKKEKCVLVNGSGVNMEKFQPVPLPAEPVFLFIGRILKDKGIVEYLEAARLVKIKYPEAKIHIVGPFDINPNSLSYDDLKVYIDDRTVEYFGKTNDVRPFIANCFVYVLPSYREGTPRTVLEAMAMGRPVITTDAPGCRETVVDGVNGFLVPVKTIDVLAEKMIWMIEHREKVNKMGEESLRICKEKFDVNKVNEVMLKAMNLKS